MFPILRIEVESEPYQTRSGNNAETDAEPLVNARHVEDDEYDEHGQQTTREDEQVLTFQPLELDTFSNAFIDVILHFLIYYLWIIKGFVTLKGKRSVGS